MTESTHSPKRRARALVASVLAVRSLVGLSAAAGAQAVDPAPTTNFSMVGVADAQAGTAISVDATVSGTFGFCNNVNGLGAELYLSGGNGTTLTVRHATVSPFVVPLHLGLLGVTSSDPAGPISEDFVTIGVAQGTPVQFGSTGSANATYGGIFAGKTGAGMVSWNYTDDITCADSLVMPILEPLLSPSTTTTAPPPPA
ncbi:MAG: hypothetical protein ACKO04_05660 [Actinomycetes bacterium]